MEITKPHQYNSNKKPPQTHTIGQSPNQQHKQNQNTPDDGWPQQGKKKPPELV